MTTTENTNETIAVSALTGEHLGRIARVETGPTNDDGERACALQGVLDQVVHYLGQDNHVRCQVTLSMELARQDSPKVSLDGHHRVTFLSP